MSSVTTPPNKAAMATACHGLLRTYPSARSASDSATSSAWLAVAASLDLGLIQCLVTRARTASAASPLSFPSERSSYSACSTMRFSSSTAGSMGLFGPA